MDTWGFLIIIIGAAIYLLSRKGSQNMKEFGILVFGVGLGLVIGAIWAASIISSAFN